MLDITPKATRSDPAAPVVSLPAFGLPAAADATITGTVELPFNDKDDKLIRSPVAVVISTKPIQFFEDGMENCTTLRCRPPKRVCCCNRCSRGIRGTGLLWIPN
ncbi:uncharacterized protein PITG_19137 [Phytophthora infestans T30-4]|uniref:Uncharacterized protein n=1 Tax=Phytophthora infestans (strain T30-4) TaxID=403677 RepID=D0NYX4_PHYIT|nr:uncharacterized protein PITG_19137 [Phytophthora infestans T30-4]EEY68757.1 hypothetical protein PITG_19137 [Phytophthora infestans T30-4]|eukprot:XP_002997449.1 hypothetical protein PITG_19137 [Phytophthora infestans T30-4]